MFTWLDTVNIGSFRKQVWIILQIDTIKFLNSIFLSAQNKVIHDKKKKKTTELPQGKIKSRMTQTFQLVNAIFSF